MEYELLNCGLIVIVGVEVVEVCVGVGLPGKLGIEVFILFLQKQIVFVEGLWTEKEGEREREGERYVRISICFFPALMK